MWHRIACALGTLALTAVPLGAQQPATGTWHAQVERRSGGTLSATLVLEAEGDSLRGTWSAAANQGAPVRATASADSVWFTFQQVDHGIHLTAVGRAAIDGDTMHGDLQWSSPTGRLLGPPLMFTAARESAAHPPEAGTGGQLETEAAFRSDLATWVRESAVPGAVGAFRFADGRWGVAAAGVSDRESGTPMPADARMPAGSVGKTFVAAVVLSLVGERRLGLDDGIAKWFGEAPWFDSLPNGREVTVRMLLNHSSGIPDYVYDSAFVAAVRSQVERGDVDARLPPIALLRFVFGHPPLFPAGRAYHYSDTEYILLGLIVERVTGKGYYTVLRRRFLDPLHLDATSPSDRRDLAGLVPGYLPSDNPLGLPVKTVGSDGRLRFNPATEWTGGGVISTASDLARWAVLLYTGKAMSWPYVHPMLESRAPHEGPGGHGLGVSISETSLGEAWGHDGEFPGYRSKMAYFPRERVAVAVQVNANRADLGAIVVRLARDVARR